MKHNPKDVKVRGVPMRRCKRCGIMWMPLEEEKAKKSKCVGKVGKDR
jgi:hypothetical protein